jgi:hypothetical protein
VTVEQELAAILEPLQRMRRSEQQAQGRLGWTASDNFERCLTAAYEDALVDLLVERGILSRAEWERRYKASLQERVQGVLEAAQRVQSGAAGVTAPR